eukprot:SAG22_NODE_284_length_13033_cov_21.541828_8_plen_72_part_00
MQLFFLFLALLCAGGSAMEPAPPPPPPDAAAAAEADTGSIFNGVIIDLFANSDPADLAHAAAQHGQIADNM